MDRTWTKERVVAVIVVALQTIAATLFHKTETGPLAAAGWGVLCTVPGLVIIWFRESLSVTGFDRGVLRESPPLMIDVLGWLFLIGLPVIFMYGLLP